jgi:hypothetical protein
MAELDDLEEQIKECAMLEAAETIRAKLGSMKKPSKLNKAIANARGITGGPRLIDATQYGDLSRKWQKLDRMLAKVTDDLDPGSAAEFLTPPDATGDKTAGPYT